MRIVSIGNCELEEHLGSGKTRLRWTEGLRKAGHDVQIFSPSDFIAFPKMRRLRRLRMGLGARRFLRSPKADLIEFYGGEFGLAINNLSKRASRPVLVQHSDGSELMNIYGETDGPKPPESKRFEYRMDVDSFARADHLVAGCKEDIDFAVRRGLKSAYRAHVISPGIDDAFLARPFCHSVSGDVAFIGSWIPRKNTGVIVKVMDEVLAARNVRFHVFGAHTEAVARHFKDPLRIVQAPKISADEMAKKLSECSIFFFPSIYEGFGMATTEAISCGLAPVVTRTGFGSDLGAIDPSFVVPFDGTQASERIISLIDNPNRCREMAENAHRITQELSWPTQIAKLVSLYERISR